MTDREIAIRILTVEEYGSGNYDDVPFDEFLMMFENDVDHCEGFDPQCGEDMARALMLAPLYRQAFNIASETEERDAPKEPRAPPPLRPFRW